jgi:hypothetical protein
MCDKDVTAGVVEFNKHEHFHLKFPPSIVREE